MGKLIAVIILLPALLGAATHISAATGNLTATGTWLATETGASAAQTSYANGTITTTSYVASSTFTCTNLDVIHGMLLAVKQSTATGTVTVGLSDDNGVTWTREVTVNATDLPTAQSFVYFVFGSTLTCDGGVDYKVGIKGSSAGNATFYGSGTDWFRQLAKNAAPGAVAAGDTLYIVGHLAGGAPGTLTSYTVTINDTTSIDFGRTDIGLGGTLATGQTAATAYTFKISGDLNVWGSGTLNLDNSGSTAKLTVTFDCTSNAEFGLWSMDGSTTTLRGQTKTVKAFLAADAAVNATSLTSDVSTAWKSGDLIAVASTTQTPGQSEQGALNGDAVGTTLTVNGFGGVGGGLAYAHSGTTPTRAEIINLTRSVKLIGASATLQGYWNIANTATVDVDHAEFSWFGADAANKYGVTVQTTTGNTNIQYSAFYNFRVWASRIEITGGSSNNITLSNNVMWNLSQGISVRATTGTWTMDSNTFITSDAYNYALVELYDIGGTFTNNTVVSAALHAVALLETGGTLGTFTGNVMHSNARNALWFVYTIASRWTVDFTAWRNGWNALAGNSADQLGGTVSGTFFGNAIANVNLALESWPFLTLLNVTSSGDSTFGTPIGLAFTGNGRHYHGMKLVNYSSGVSSGIKVGHTSGDISISTSNNLIDIVGDNVTLASTTQIASWDTTNVIDKSRTQIQRLGGTAGNHKTWVNMRGTITTDTTIFKTASPSERLTPVSATLTLDSSVINKVVASGATATFSAQVRKSTAGDGAAYNGNQPQLILLRNVACGINADTVLDTMTVAAGNWEELTGTSAAVTDNCVLEAVVRVDGTAGWINVDDADTNASAYWKKGEVFSASGAGLSGGGEHSSISIR